MRRWFISFFERVFNKKSIYWTDDVLGLLVFVDIYTGWPFGSTAAFLSSFNGLLPYLESCFDVDRPHQYDIVTLTSTF